MARTIGAKNKPKLIAVTLEQLNKFFKPETKIRISKEYSFLFGEFEHVEDFVEPVEEFNELEKNPENAKKVEVTVFDFNNS